MKKALLFYRTMKRTQTSIHSRLSGLFSFFSDLKSYKNLKANSAFALRDENLKPMIFDKTTNTPVDPVYFYQDAWCAKKIFENKPTHHTDVASEAGFIGIVSQFVPTTMVDIRPVDLRMPGFEFKTGDVTHLPFPDNSIESLSSICVIEHIGLGRYGDPLDQFGSEKSAEELKRVLKPEGNLYISVPIDRESRIYFNAHRAFTREHVLKLFLPLSLVEEKYIYKRDLFDLYDPERGFGTGLYHFKKQ
ncbi:MAG: DUF268 domain-containing protein [Patescibacteria group bacterium]